MNIQTYTFESPYPNQIQRGEPVKQFGESEKSQTSQSEKEQSTQSAAPNLELSSVVPQKSVPNVANSTSDVLLSDSLSEFSRVSSQLQAAQAYAN